MALTKYNVLETFPVGGYQTAISEHLASAHIHTYIYILKHKHKQHFDMQQRPTAVFINALGHTHTHKNTRMDIQTGAVINSTTTMVIPLSPLPFPRFPPIYPDLPRFSSISLDFPGFPPIVLIVPKCHPRFHLANWHHQVAWIKADAKAILAIHEHVITNNDRLSVQHNDYNTWTLNIRGVKMEDAGKYMCQVNTDPMKMQVSAASSQRVPTLQLSCPEKRIICFLSRL